MTVGERIRRIRKENGMTLQKFGEKLGVTGANISALELGKATVTDRAIRDICQNFGVREEWLRTGDGPMMQEKPRDELLASELEAVLTAGDDDFRKALIRWIVRMPPERWHVIEEVVRDLLDDVRNLAPAESAPPEPRNVHDMTDDEMREELERQLDGARIAAEKGTDTSSISGPTNSGTA